MAIQNHLTLQLVPILLDMIVLNHNHHHIHFVEELVEIKNLVRHNLFVSEERVETLQWTSQMALLDVEHLEGWAFTDVVNILFIGQAIPRP